MLGKISYDDSNPILPKLSIITVVLNGEKSLEKTILSVINQSYPNIEYIIIDGASSDGTIDIIKKYQNRISKWISEPDKGVYDAMNKGIGLSSGELIGIINSDDHYAPEIFNNIVDLYLKNHCKCIAGNLDLINNEGETINNIKYCKKYVKRIMKGGPASHPTIFVPREIYQIVGLFDTNYRIAADFEWQIRGIVKYKVEYAFIDDTVAYMKIGGISSGLSNRYSVIKEIFQIRFKYRIEAALILGLRDLINYLIKLTLNKLKIIDEESS
jgi:glycosyltransferase involved in cell wall biosynthesis